LLAGIGIGESDGEETCSGEVLAESLKPIVEEDAHKKEINKDQYYS